MAKAKEITGCTILNPLTTAAAMRAVKMLSEMDLLKEYRLVLRPGCGGPGRPGPLS